MTSVPAGRQQLRHHALWGSQTWPLDLHMEADLACHPVTSGPQQLTLTASSFATAGSFSCLRPKSLPTAPVTSASFCFSRTILPAGST